MGGRVSGGNKLIMFSGANLSKCWNIVKVLCQNQNYLGKVTLKKFTQKSKNKISSRTEKGYNKYYNMSVRGDKTSKNTDR